MSAIYVSIPIADESKRRTEELRVVLNYLQEDDRYIITDFILNPGQKDERFSELQTLQRNNETTKDDVRCLTEPSIIISFVNPTSYGQGFAEGYTVGRKLSGDAVRMLKLMHEDDWNEGISKIAGNSAYADFRIYSTPEEALGFVKEFLEKPQSSEGNLKNRERE